MNDEIGTSRRKDLPTEAELIAWKDLSRDPTELWKVPFDPCPYIGFTAPDGRPAIEIGLKGTF